MKTIHYVFIVLLVLAIFAVEYDLSKRPKPAVLATKTVAVVPDMTLINAKLALAEEKSNDAAAAAFIADFKKQADEIGKLQGDPEAVQLKMKTLAEKMSGRDVQELYQVISDEKNNGDQRALAVELLSLKNDTASLTALQNFVANNNTVNGTKWDRKKEFETVLRAQAVESIAAYPQKEIALSTLNFLHQKVDESFLADRINRATNHLLGRASSPQDQDEAALKELVE